MENSKEPKSNPDNDPMDRRDFIQKSTLGTMMLSSKNIHTIFKDRPMGVVVHSYASRWGSKTASKKYPGFQNAIDMIEHCHTIGAGGVQVMVRDWSADFAKKVREKREKLGLYLEGSIGLPAAAENVSAFENEVVQAKEAGAQILRTVCLSGRRYENFQSKESFEEFRKKSITSIQLAEPIVRKHKVRLAIENHKDWLAKDLLEILKIIGSEWVGVTLDFGNNISLMEDSMEVAQQLAPFSFSTHVKDMAVEEYTEGFLLSEIPLGEGFLNLAAIVDICRKHNPDITFNLEMITRDPLQIPCLTQNYWVTMEGTQARELARMLFTVRQNKFNSSLPKVSHLNPEERLEVEEKNILTSFSYSKTKLGLK